MEQVEKIYDTGPAIFDVAEREKISAQEAAMHVAEQRISQIGRLQMTR